MKYLCFVGLLITLVACTKDQVPEPAYNLELPVGFPSPDIPVDNQLTNARIELGKRLFFDPILSRDSTISCGSCHLPKQLFTDGNKVSIGIENRKGIRNAPTLANVAYQKSLLMEGGVPSLELQVIAPIEDTNEMDFDALQVVERLKRHPIYRELAQRAYEREPDLFVLTRSIASYERTLLSGDSRFDQYYYQNKKNILTDSEQRGLDLFFSEGLQCATCHSGHNFTDGDFHNIGLYTDYEDIGRARVTVLDSDIGRFKTPTLRNVALTAPYMHDGSLASLEEVIEHFNAGGHSHPNKDNRVKPLNLTAENKADLLSFLQSLTDSSFIKKHD